MTARSPERWRGAVGPTRLQPLRRHGRPLDRGNRDGRTSRAAAKRSRPRLEGGPRGGDVGTGHRRDSGTGDRRRPTRRAWRRRRPEVPSGRHPRPSPRTGACCRRRTSQGRTRHGCGRTTCTSSGGSYAQTRTTQQDHRSRSVRQGARRWARSLAQGSPGASTALPSASARGTDPILTDRLLLTPIRVEPAEEVERHFGGPLVGCWTGPWTPAGVRAWAQGMATRCRSCAADR